MERAIKMTKEQLSAINIFATNQQQALTALANLQQIGITEKEIIDILGIVRRWNDQQQEQQQHPGLNQGNGSSSNSGVIAGGNGSIH